MDVGFKIYSFNPKLWWKILRLRHTNSNLLKGSILPLNNTILLRGVRNRMMHMDTCIFAILDEIKLEILTTILISKDLEFPPRLVFNQGSKDFEEVKNFRLMLWEVNQQYLEKSSMKVSAYLSSIMDILGCGPTISLWINSTSAEVLA